MLTKIFMAVMSLVFVSSAFAQDVKLVDILAEESKKTLAKQKEELAKLTPAAPVVTMNQIASQNLVKPKPINTEPRTISVFGVSPDYKAEMEINGKVLLVKTGQTIQNYKVASINPIGVTLTSTLKTKKTSKVRSKIVANKAAEVTTNVPKKVVTVKRKTPSSSTVVTPLVVSRFFPLPQQ